ncbi:DUF1285 domain-containing protein [Actibacterium ureilyticum]|uniref:DUF1285 domain-containing protein n=1 Tax=Actibacterium ureilyticum TaxID=1590614 RepID=UPI000BAB218B|nr:DUF1285 domain-containing protein [Actibacterium ureilyticum]
MAKNQNGQNIVTPSPDRLAQAAQKAANGGLPPVHLWNPPFCGDIDMRIARDGTWFYQGTPINRPRMVRLFSTILRRDGDAYFLVTPVEKVGITVDDVPFVAVDFTVENPGTDQVLIFETALGDTAPAGPDHPIRVAQSPESDAPAPYVAIRAGLEARIDRKSFYRMVDLGQEEVIDGTAWFGIRSGGTFFRLIPAHALT